MFTSISIGISPQIYAIMASGKEVVREVLLILPFMFLKVEYQNWPPGGIREYFLLCFCLLVTSTNKSNKTPGNKLAS